MTPEDPAHDPSSYPVARPSLVTEGLLAAGGFLAGRLSTQSRSMGLPLILAAGGLAAWKLLARKNSGTAHPKGVGSHRPRALVSPTTGAVTRDVPDESPFESEEAFMRYFLAESSGSQKFPDGDVDDHEPLSLLVEEAEPPVVFETEEDFLRTFLEEKGAAMLSFGPNGRSFSEEENPEPLLDSTWNFKVGQQAVPDYVLASDGDTQGEVAETEIDCQLPVSKDPVDPNVETETCALDMEKQLAIPVAEELGFPPELPEPAEIAQVPEMDTTAVPAAPSAVIECLARSPEELAAHNAAWLLGLEPLPALEFPEQSPTKAGPSCMTAEIPDEIQLSGLELDPSAGIGGNRQAILGNLFDEEPESLVETSTGETTATSEAVKTAAETMSTQSDGPNTDSAGAQDSSNQSQPHQAHLRPLNVRTSLVSKRVVPRAPVTVTVEEGKKSWLGWWR